MSLLLDALKKTGAGTNEKESQTSASEMTLEELPAKQTAAPAPVSSQSNNVTPRSTGENLFSAKKAPVVNKKFQYNLGIVPTAIIIGLILGTAGSIYVWYEIQPPKAGQYHRPAAQVAAVNPAPVPTPRPIPMLTQAPETLPAAETQAVETRPNPPLKTIQKKHTPTIKPKQSPVSREDRKSVV